MSVKKETSAVDEETARFLRRGEPSPAPRESDIAVGPSLIFDEETGRAIAVERSPPPSQLTSTQQQAFEALSSSAARLPRQRPRFHTVQDLDLALNQAIEGKITSKNAWASKEASDLLEGITHTIQNTLDASATADDYAGFAKAATVVEGCSKVWTSRVDSTHQQTNLMVQRLLRNDEKERGGAGGVAGADGSAEGEGVEEGANGDNRRRRGLRGRGGIGAGAARTLALDASEINLDSKAKTALTQGGMNAQFRAITEKFDQGNAQGLLTNNAPQGMRGNLILDIDYARADAGVSFSARDYRKMAAQQQEKQATGRQRRQGRGSGASAEEEGEEIKSEQMDEDTRTSRRGSDGGGGRVSMALRQLVEEDAFLDAPEAHFTLPPYEPRALTASGLLSARNSVRLSQSHSSADLPGRGSQRASADAATAAAANAAEALLMVPHTNAPFAADASGLNTSAPRSGDGSEAVQRIYDGHGDADDDDWGGDGGGFDDDDAYNDDVSHDAANGLPGQSETSVAAELIMNGADIGAAARQLVSGAASMDAMDYLLGSAGTVQQLALEADDPSAWCPLSSVAPASAPHAALSGGVAPNSELSKLRKEHRFGVPASIGGGNVAAMTAGSSAGLLKHAPDAATGKAAGKKQKSVVFDLPADGLHTNISSSGDGVFALEQSDINQSALKQSQTATKNVTALGRELVLGRDAERSVLPYIQSSFQRTKAETAGLLLPEMPQPGTTMPAYLPYPVQVSDFFQPFCTPQVEWNLLRKSATGQVLDLRTGAAVGAPGASQRGSGGSHTTAHRRGGEDGSGVAGEGDTRFDMPVEFFPGGAEFNDDYDDDGGYDAFGPDDNDDAYNAEAQAADDALRAERFLLAQFNAQQMSAAAGLASGRPSSSDASGARASFQGDLSDLAKMLNAPEATVPNQVDVVQLRATMWEALQHQMEINPYIPTTVQWTGGQRAAGEDSSEDDEDGEDKQAHTHTQLRDPNAPLLKKHAQRVLASKRRREGEDEAEEQEDEEESRDERDADDAATPRRRPKKQRAVGDDRTAQTADQRKKQYAVGLAHTESDSDKEDDSDENEAEPRHKISKRDALPHFSQVVRSVLPSVPTISSTGTLSPAFFFFSILFLANEHNVVLDNVSSLDDLIVRGVAPGVTAGGH